MRESGPHAILNISFTKLECHSILNIAFTTPKQSVGVGSHVTTVLKKNSQDARNWSPFHPEHFIHQVTMPFHPEHFTQWACIPECWAETVEQKMLNKSSCTKTGVQKLLYKNKGSIQQLEGQLEVGWLAADQPVSCLLLCLRRELPSPPGIPKPGCLQFPLLVDMGRQ